MADKTLYSDYYYVFPQYLEKEDQKDNKLDPINIVAWITDMLGSDFKSYPNISHQDTVLDPGRIQVLHEAKDGIYEIQFLRLRESSPAEIAKANGELIPLNLDDGDYLAESCSVLFDPLTMIAVVQRSYYGANMGFLKTYLNRLIYDENNKRMIQFSPLMGDKINLHFLIGKTIKKFSAQVCYEGEPLRIGNDMSNFKRYCPANVDICVKAKRGKNGSLDKQAVLDQLAILKEDGSTQKLSVAILNEEKRMKTIDLLDDHIMDSFSIRNITKKHPAIHALIYPAMKGQYIARVQSCDDKRFEARRAWIYEHEAKK